MADDKKYISKYTAEEIENILDVSNTKPFIIYYDKANSLYRFFKDEDKRDTWIAAYEAGEMTSEIDALQFSDPITAPQPQSLSIIGLKTNQYVLYGSTGTYLEFTFKTMDSNSNVINESVDCYYTFKTSSGTVAASNIYNAGTEVKMNIDSYLQLGTNTITIFMRGRSTGATKTEVVTYYVVQLDISSTFDISKSIAPNTNFDVTYTVEGQGDKTVQFYIDGTLVSTASVSSLETLAQRTQVINNSSGTYKTDKRHSLQIRAFMTAGDQQFYSKILYYEFVIAGAKPNGDEQTLTLISEEFPSKKGITVDSLPGLSGEQYVTTTINWAYYSSNPLKQSSTITWRLYTSDGTATTLATRLADVTSAVTDRMPEPLSFMPTEVGDYKLQALIGNTIITEYTISVVKNTSGLLETTEGLTMKLSGLGRSNDEPDDTKTSWADRGYSATFSNQPWNSTSGWNDDALWLNNGATAVINNKPLAEEIGVTTKNGAVIEVEFETFNIDSEDAEVLSISGTGLSQSFKIKGSSATLTGSFGTTLTTKFKSEERVKLAFVIFPRATGTYPQKMFVYSNGVLSGGAGYNYEESFNIGSSEDTSSNVGKINLGNSQSKAGIKIYYIRTYKTAINMYEQLNNYFIDSGENLQTLVDDNDIYTTGTKNFDIDKLESLVTTIKFTGPLDDLINKGGKHTCYGALELTCPSDSSINFHCENAELKNSGQSTLDKPVPSLHIKLNKNNNVCYDRDDKPLARNRWAFRSGNVKEKKIRVNSMYMDSSCAHCGALLKMISEVFPKVMIDSKYVLRIPAQEYAYNTYPTAMRSKYGEDPNGNSWKFPYTIRMTPDAIPAILVWRPNENSSYQFLGQYVIMEEKKANFANGMRSIYDNINASTSMPDPFQDNDLEGNKLWDNANCHQFELLTSTDDLTLFLDDSKYSNATERAKNFELIYPDEDDLLEDDPSGASLQAEWDLFYNTFVHPICDTNNSTKYPTQAQRQAAFEELMYGTNPILDRWFFAAYYIIVLRCALSDSFARNMEITTYEKNSAGNPIWLPKFWDLDMAFGLTQNGNCVIEPGSDRNSIVPGTASDYALSGKMKLDDGSIKSSWLWDALENSEQFKKDIKTMDQALFTAGWNYNNLVEMLDENFVDNWSESIYNESGVTKYLDYDQLINLQGDRTPDRHNFIKKSFTYFDALNCVGEYTSKVIQARTDIPGESTSGLTIGIKAGATTYYGWGTSISVDYSGKYLEKGQSFDLPIQRNLQKNNPLHIYAATNIEELDLSKVAQYLASDLNFTYTYDSVTGTCLKKVNIGVPKTSMNNGVFNKSATMNTFTLFDPTSPVGALSKVEEFNIQGLNYMLNIDTQLSYMSSLKKFYAAGTILNSFKPADGTLLSDIELPTTVQTISMSGCSLGDSSTNCIVKWYKTNTVSGWYTTSNTQGAVEIASTSLLPTTDDGKLYVVPSDISGYKKHNGTSWVEATVTEYNNAESKKTIEEWPTDTSDLSVLAVYRICSLTYYKWSSGIPSSITETTIPSTLTTLIFTGMGQNKGTQCLITKWIQALAAADTAAGGTGNIYKGCTLNYTNVNWTDVSITDLLNIAKIPSDKRNITGYIKCSTEFTTTQMNQLMSAFGENIFNKSNILCIDCESTNVIISATGTNTEIVNGVINTLQGTEAKLNATGFPIMSSDEVNYVWSVKTGENEYMQGTDSDPWIHVDSYTQINSKTGIVQTIECPRTDNTDLLINLYVVKYSGGVSAGSGEIQMKINRRTYPDATRIDYTSNNVEATVKVYNGSYQISKIGTYVFNSKFTRTDEASYTGTLKDTNGGIWSTTNFKENYVSSLTSGYTTGNDKDTEFRLNVSALPSNDSSCPDDEFTFTLGYTSNWKNDLTLTATPISICVSNKVSNILSNDAVNSNPALYYSLIQAGYQREDSTKFAFSSLDLKNNKDASGNTIETLNIKTLLETWIEENPGTSISLNNLKNLNSGSYNIARYLRGVKTLNLSDCSALNTDINVNGQSYETLNLEGTNVNAIIGSNSSLKILKLGTPTNVTINNPTNLKESDISIQVTSNISTLVLKNLKNNTTFTEAHKILRSGIKSTDSIHLEIEQSTETAETVSSIFLEDLLNIFSRLDETSVIKGKIKVSGYYAATLETIRTKFNNSSFIIETEGTENDYIYIPFTDSIFKNKVSLVWGDKYNSTTSIGTTQTQANLITTLGTNLQNTDIVDLSDLWKLTNLTFPTTTEENSPFKGCSELRKVKFPTLLPKLGSYTFNTNTLNEIDFSGCTGLTEIEENAFYGSNGNNNAVINLSNCSSLVSANLLSLDLVKELTIEGNNTITTLII